MIITIKLTGEDLRRMPDGTYSKDYLASIEDKLSEQLQAEADDLLIEIMEEEIEDDN